MRVNFDLLRGFFLLGSFFLDRSAEGDRVLGRFLHFRGRSRRGGSLSQLLGISENSLNDFFNREFLQDFTDFDIISRGTTDDGGNDFRNSLLRLKNALLGLRLLVFALIFLFLLSFFIRLLLLLFFLFLLNFFITLPLLFFLFLLLFRLFSRLGRGSVVVKSAKELVEININHLVTLVSRELRDDLLSCSIGFNTNEHLRSQFRLLDLEESVVAVDTVGFTLFTNIVVRAIDALVSHTNNGRSLATVTDETLMDDIGRGLLKSGLALVKLSQDLALD